MKSVPALVRSVLAQHLDCDPGKIHPWQNLEIDLDVTPLELILMALEIEEAQGIDLQVEALDHVATVGDFFAFVSFAVARHREDDRRQPCAHHAHRAMSP